jgi:two-component system, cell cycle sensor histidine kinase and response regulator CckA
LSHQPKKSAILTAGPPWVRYAFALTTCALAILTELFLDRITSDPIYPFLPGFAAIIASAAWAGAGAGLLSTTVLVVWSVFDLSQSPSSPPNILLRCLVFLMEGALLSAGSRRMWRFSREAALSEAWHRQLVETATEGIWVHNDQGLITYANARMAELLGVTVEELTGRNVDEFFLPADLSVERIRAANLRSGQKVQFDRRLRRRDGAEIWVLACCNLVQGQEPGALAMMTDITERKSAEYALRRSEERFRNLFEHVLEGVYQSTPDGRILAANPMLLRMLCLTSEAQLNDVNIAQHLYVDANIRQRLLEQLEQEGGFQNVEYELRRRDGAIITVLENARVVKDENGIVLYYEGTLTDITPRKRIEEALRQAQKVEALGRLAGGIAHDFNNVLTLITGFTELALTELSPSHPAHASMEQVQQAAESAIALTKQLVSFSRRQAPVEGSNDLNRAIESARPALSTLLTPLGESKSDVVFSLCRESAPVYAGQKPIEQILLSLSGAVCKSAGTDGFEIRTELVNLSDEFCQRMDGIQAGRYVALSIGKLSMSRLLAEPVINIAQAADSAAMGLSATHAAISRMGGFLIAGHASFHVFLPRALAPARLEPRELVEPGPAGETILLVEDEPLVRQSSREMLERQGYRVILATDENEAERISGGAGTFDLLITDAVMPTISGAELARRLRASHPGLKVLFISEDGGSENPAFLQKPFSADSLGRKIRQIFNRP